MSDERSTFRVRVELSNDLMDTEVSTDVLTTDAVRAFAVVWQAAQSDMAPFGVSVADIIDISVTRVEYLETTEEEEA